MIGAAHEKTPVPDGLDALGTRVEVTGSEADRHSENNTENSKNATRPRIAGTLHIRVPK